MKRSINSFSLFNQFKSPTFLLVVLLSFNILLIPTVNAQLDSTFGTDGVTTTDVLLTDSPMATFVLPNEKILILNESREFGQPNRYYFVRYTSNGILDLTYGVNGIKQLSPPSTGIAALITGAIRQPDGKFLLIGADGSSGYISRFNEDGTIDLSFGTNGVHRPNIDFNGNDILEGVVILPNGKIFTVGRNNNNKLFFIRYLSNGALDESFNGEGFIINNVPSPSIKKMFLQSTGKILIFGSDVNQVLLKRFNADGTPDSSFTNLTQTGSVSNYRQLLVLPDDKILYATVFQKSESLERVSSDIIVRKYTANGTIDSSFGSGGSMSFDVTTTFDDDVFALAVQPDGQIIVGCVTEVQPNRTKTESWMLSLARISATGTLNGKFLLTKSANSGRASIDILPDGKILTVFERYDQNFRTDLLLTRSIAIPLQTYNFKGVPFDYLRANTNGFVIDGVSDPTVFRPSESKWYVHPRVPEFAEFIFGLPNDVLVSSDFLGNLGADLAVFRPSNGTWYLAKSFYLSAQNFMTVQWGVNGDIPAPGDFDNDSKADIAVFRPSNGVWYIRNSNDNSFRILQWGINGDKPVVGDYDGDGKADVAVWRPSDGVWYVLQSSNGQPSFTRFGLDGDIPVQEDYDGDGKTDIAVWRPSTGIWYVLRSSDGGFSAVQWGLSADYAVPADYDGDKKTDIAVWRPSQGRWYVLRSSDLALGLYYWGTNGDVVPQRRQ